MCAFAKSDDLDFLEKIPSEYFIYSYNNPDFFKKRAFIGNGYIGMDVSGNLGQGFGICEPNDPFPTLYVGGVYGYSNKDNGRPWGDLSHIFRAMNLFGLIPGEQDPDDVFYIPESSSFYQEVDMERAIVTTKAKWGPYHYEAEIMLLRNFSHFGVLRLRFTPIASENPGGVFYYLARKNPLSKYEKLTHKRKKNIEIFDGYIREDGFDFDEKGLFHIVQTAAVKITDDEGNEIVHSVEWETISQDEENGNITMDGEESICPEKSLDYDGDWCRRCKIEIDPNYLKTGKPIVFIIYSGLFHDYDIGINRKYERDLNEHFFKVLDGSGADRNDDEEILKALKMESLDYASSSSDLGDKISLIDYALFETLDVMERPYDLLKEAHIDSWKYEIWCGLIEVPDEEVQRRIIASMYQMGCSFKTGYINSAGPTGLNNSAWGGRIFWDADLWMNLGLVLWAPDLSRNIVEFRARTIIGADQNRINHAKNYGFNDLDRGIKYPWQSGTSGRELAPVGWELQEHISCDVVFGQYLYWLASGDKNYLRNIAYPIAVLVCDYLQKRVVLGHDGKYHFPKVIPADEFVFPNPVDDDAFTNLYVSRIMGITIEWSKMLGFKYPAEWEKIRNNMFYNFDEGKNVVIEYTGYKGDAIKQADVNLLTFPIEWSFKDSVKRANMLYYYDKLPENKIMMSSSIFSIIAAELAMKDKAWEYFTDLFKHFHPDLSYIVSESPVNNCYPFLTGIGGFISVLFYGFAGIRFRPQGILLNPLIPDNLNEITFNCMFYQGRRFRMVIGDKGNRIIITNLLDPADFVIYFPEHNKYAPESDDIRSSSSFGMRIVSAPEYTSDPPQKAELSGHKMEYMARFFLGKGESITLVKNAEK